MSVQKQQLNKTAKSLYDDIVRIRAQTKLEKKNNNKNEGTTTKNDIALNTVMRQMMDMIKESNELIAELSSKVRNHEMKTSNLEQTVSKLQTGYRQLDVVVNNNCNDLKALHRSNNQNELTLREIFLKIGKFDQNGGRNYNDSMFKGIAERLRRLEDSDDLNINHHSVNQTVIPSFPNMMEIQTNVQQNLMKSLNETRADVEVELKKLKEKTRDEMKILESKLDNLERSFSKRRHDSTDLQAEFKNFKSEIKSELTFNSDVSRRKLVKNQPLLDNKKRDGEDLLNSCKLRDIIKIEQSVEKLRDDIENKIFKIENKYSEKFSSLRDRYEEKESAMVEKIKKIEKKICKSNNLLQRQASTNSISLLPPLIESKTYDFTNRPNTTMFREKTQKVFNSIFKSERKRVAETLQAIIDSLRGEIDEKNNSGRKRVESLIFSDMAKRDNQFQLFEKRVNILSNKLESIMPEMAKHSKICQIEFKKVVDESKSNLLKEAGKLTDKSRNEITMIAEDVERKINGLCDEQDFQRGDFLKNFENITKVVDQLERKYHKQSQSWRMSAEERFDEVLRMVKDTEKLKEHNFMNNSMSWFQI